MLPSFKNQLSGAAVFARIIVSPAQLLKTQKARNRSLQLSITFDIISRVKSVIRKERNNEDFDQTNTGTP
jgi:hypothetical protein